MVSTYSLPILFFSFLCNTSFFYYFILKIRLRKLTRFAGDCSLEVYQQHHLQHSLSLSLASFFLFKKLTTFYPIFFHSLGDCSARYWCINGSASATPNDGVTGVECPAGSYCERGTEVPTPCPLGTWSASTLLGLQAECQQCTGGLVLLHLLFILFLFIKNLYLLTHLDVLYQMSTPPLHSNSLHFLNFIYFYYKKICTITAWASP